MKKLRLNGSDVEVSELAFGTDLIGSKLDRARSFALLDFYREHGGNFLDTANFYASWLPGCVGGESESTIGAWMKERGNREEMVISTKLAFDYPGSQGGLSAAEIEKECEKSLKRLGTDWIDVYQAHRDDRNTALEETMAAFDRLIQAGKVRLIGASNLSLWRIAEANLIARSRGWRPYTLVEQRYTYLRPRHGADFGPQIFLSDELKDYAVCHGVTLMGYSVLLQGAYVRRDREIPAQFAGQDSSARLDALRAVAQDAGCTPVQVIFAWMRQSSPPVLPIIAGSQTEQLQENIDALRLVLSEEQMKRLDSAGNPHIETAWIQPT